MIQWSPSSFSSTKWKHNVFVSFRGEDIRNSFADHLFGALKREGIEHVFRDDRDIKHGDHISTELIEAIEGSQVLIPVFSKNYANSTWCMRELAKIMECKNWEAPTGRRRVLPVFYDVSPSEVRKQSGDYGKAFAEHEAKVNYDPQMVQSWRKALEEVADISGSSDVQNKHEYEEIQKIAERVKDLLDPQFSGFDGLVGMQSRVEKLEELLAIDSSDGVRVIGVCGMGGSGKTTLIEKTYERNYHKYVTHCLIDDPRKFFLDVRQATNNRLCHGKALIVFDNFDKVGLRKLDLKRKSLCEGSRIIITARDRQILKYNEVDEIYDAELLDCEEAHQLFCGKAFKHNLIMREYEELIGRALDYAQGLPLAIDVLGSHLYDRDISLWENALESLKDDPKIMDVLKVSFNDLDSEQKNIFLDIACFFEGYGISKLKKMLEYRGFEPHYGIAVLISKSLITERFGSIWMHNELQELGKYIIREQAPEEPGKWSRIWSYKDFRRLMSEEVKVMDNIEAIVLQYNEVRYEMECEMEYEMDYDEMEDTSLKADALSRMNRLRLLLLPVDMEFSGTLHYLSKELRYLEWASYPFNYFPSSCKLNNLVELHMPFSRIRQLWEGKRPKHLYKLKYMDLSDSGNLKRIPDLSEAPNLLELNLAGCTNLVRTPNLSDAWNLLDLNLVGCTNLVRTPNLSGARNLQKVNLEGCTNLIDPLIGDLSKLVRLNLRNCASLASLPNSIFNATSLIYVNLEGCSKAFQRELSGNPRDIGTSDNLSAPSSSKRIKRMLPFHSLPRCYNLQYLNLSYCNLVNIPESLASLCCLNELILDGNNFVELPSFIGKLPKLRTLRSDYCKQLASISAFPLEESYSVDIRFFDCTKLAEMESLSRSALSSMIQVLKVHKESHPKITIIIPGPGTRIPLWYNNQSVGGSISIGSFPNADDSNWIGIAFCATFVAHFRTKWASLQGKKYSVGCELLLGNRIFNDISIILHDARNEPTIELVHLFLHYFTRQELTNLYLPFRGTNYDPNTFRFSLCGGLPTIGLHDEDYITHLEVKNCGFRMVFKQDLEEYE